MFPTRAGGSTPMTTKAGVGMSHHHNPNVAGREAAEQALKNAGITKPDFVFMFASIGYDQHSLLRTVRDRKSTRLNSSHANISYAVFCLKKKKHTERLKIRNVL